MLYFAIFFVFDILQSVKMWTLWPTAPWCSGSSSAAGLTSDKCAARRARDTEETMKLTNIVHVPLSHTTRQPSLYLCQRGALLDWLGHIHITGQGRPSLDLKPSGSSWVKSAYVGFLYSTGGRAAETWRDRVGEKPVSSVLPLSLSLSHSLTLTLTPILSLIVLVLHILHFGHRTGHGMSLYLLQWPRVFKPCNLKFKI